MSRYISIKRIKYLGTNVTEEAKDLYPNNTKQSPKELKKI